jgi:hypothetical protein
MPNTELGHQREDNSFMYLMTHMNDIFNKMNLELSGLEEKNTGVRGTRNSIVK